MVVLIRWLVLTVLMWVGVAHAVVPKVSYWETKGGLVNYTAEYSATGANWVASCDAWLAAWPNSATIVVKKAAYQTYCNYIVKSKATGEEIFSNAAVPTQEYANVCPANSALIAGSNTCACNTGYQEDASHTACVVVPNDCQLNAGQSAGVWKYDGGYGAQPNSLASEICKKANPDGKRCVVKVADPQCQQVKLQGTGNPFWLCKGDAFYTGGYGVGSACDRSTAAGGDGGPGGSLPEVSVSPSPDPLPPGTAGPSSCPQGTFEGTINGVHTCVDNIDSPTTGKSPQSGQTSVKNPDGSTTTTTTTGTTTCSQGSCTTINNVSSNITNNPASTCPQGTTPSGPNGSASSCTGTSTNSSTQAQSEFCKANPKDKQCAGSGNGGFGGSCAAGFVAVGDDPVLNAMAREQYTRNCQIFDEYANFAADWKVTSVGDVKTTRAASGGEKDVDASGWLGFLNTPTETAACPHGKDMVLLGQSYTLSLDPLCEVGEGIRPFVLAIAVLLGLRIFMRSVLT